MMETQSTSIPGIRSLSFCLTQRHGIRGRGSRDRALSGPHRAQRLPANCQQGQSGQGGGRRQAETIIFSSRHAECDAASPGVLGEPEQDAASSLSLYPACLSISTVLVAGSAQAHGDAMNTSLLQQAFSNGVEQHTDGLILADFSLLPSFNGVPFQILGFLLHHPFVTLALALAVNYVLPRAFRAAVRFLVIPLVLGGVAWVALQNPSAAWGFARGAFDFITHHTIETSAVILIGLGFLLSPYLLLGGAIFLLLFGVPNVPAFLKPLVPAPLLEVQRRADEIQKGLQGPLRLLGDGFESTTGGIQKSLGMRGP